MKSLLILLILCCLSSGVGAAQIEGRVVFNDAPLAGMIVQAFADLNPAGQTLGASVISDAEGHFLLEVPAGFVALYAHAEDGKYFAFCGRNPLLVMESAAPIWAGLQAVKVTAATILGYPDEYAAALEGRVLSNGQPVVGAYVSLYLDVAEDLKGQGYRLSAPTAEDGSFVFDGLPESDYYLVARKRQNRARVGPLASGDLLGVYAANPLLLKSGTTTQVELPLVTRKPSQGSVALPDRPGTIRLSGRVVDEAGLPVEGVHFFAYRNSVIGHQRPVALSAETKADGSFELSFREAGLYYVGARQAYGDSPAPGELFGLYEGRADHGLIINAKHNQPIEIRVAPIRLD
ncbi:MAG: carboxypeptidase-like regulatory domain-containing protein [Geopsychrobacter sp.]|nr:carboxypeptidase-like regulatory domain-containing protein [Geopsychrobacter sp.]